MCCKLCGYFEQTSTQGPIQLLRKGLFLIVNEKKFCQEKYECLKYTMDTNYAAICLPGIVNQLEKNTRLKQMN